MTWTPDDVPSQLGQVIVLVGPHCPEGRAIASVLLARGAHLMLVSPWADCLVELRNELLVESPLANIGIMEIREGTPAGATVAARTIVAVHPRIDLLIHLGCPILHPDAEPMDSVRAVTFPAIGYFAFTATMMPGLMASPSARIVTITPRSDERRHEAVDGQAPAATKLTDIAGVDVDDTISLLDFPLELHRRLRAAGSHVQSLAVDPGREGDSVLSALSRAGGALNQRFAAHQAIRRAAPLLQAATDPTARGGELYTPMFNTSGPPMRLSMRGTDELTARRRWETTSSRSQTDFADALTRTEHA